MADDYTYLGPVSENIKIVPGSKIPKPDTFDEECFFKYVEFNQCEWYNKRSNPESSDARKAKLALFMRGKQSCLWVQTIGRVGGLNTESTGDEGGNNAPQPSEILDDIDKEDYRKITCCMKTPYGTLIPQIIVPTIEELYENRLKYEVAFNQDVKFTEEQKTDGYTWRLTKDIDKFYTTDINDINSIGYKKSDRYGVADELLQCVDCSRTSEPQNEANPDGIFLSRGYRCITTESKTGKGCFALCYDVTHVNPPGNGDTDEIKRLCPKMNVRLSGIFGPNLHTDKHDVQVIIPQEGSIIGNVDDSEESGTFSYAENDVCPANCEKNRNNGAMDLRYILFYPIYKGFMMTSTVLGNVENKSGFLIQYEDENSNITSKCEVYGVKKPNDPSNAQSTSDDIENRDQLMEWFPTLFQQTQDRKGIKIYVNNSGKMSFSDYVDVEFVKSTGKFCYYPIYFQRKIKFTFYFKGAYVPDSEDDPNNDISNKAGKYKFYPIICTHLGEETGDEWSDGDSDNSNGRGHLDRNGAMPITHYRKVITDDENEETIYAVDFEYTAKKMQRYPIEFVGVVITLVRESPKFKITNGNGVFSCTSDVEGYYSGLYREELSFGSGNGFFALISQLSISANLEGVSGSMTLDGYPLTQGIEPMNQRQSVGEVDFAIQQNGKHQLFKGYGMELSTNDSEGSYNIGVNLYGVNRKAEDMQLICPPMWDGDRLEMVCNYFQKYLNLKIKMIDHTVKSYSGAKPVAVSLDDYYSTNGTWRCDTKYLIGGRKKASPTFRLPRSINWRSPAVVFANGTTCLEALKELGKKTGALLVPQLDGTLTFYELDNVGKPFYVDNQTSTVVFKNSDIISFSLQPQLQNKFNSIATFGMLKRKNAEGKTVNDENVEFGSFYTRTNEVTQAYNGKINNNEFANARSYFGDSPGLDYGTQFPWAKHSVFVEQGFMKKSELKRVHDNRVKFSSSEQYIGNLTVRGNTLVDHMYQRIQVGGEDYFVISIEHSIDAGSKVWTTSYQIQCIHNPPKKGTGFGF